MMNKLIVLLLAFASVPASAADCRLPWGPVLKDGDSVIAWNYAQPPSTLNCRSEVRSCMDGFLTGSFQYASCNQPARVQWMWLN